MTAVTRLVGTPGPAAHGPSARGDPGASGRDPRQPRAAADPTLPVPLARGAAFVALAGFGALHWMGMLDPAAPGRAGLALLIGGAAAVALLAAGRLGGRRTQLAALGVAIVALALALLAGGIPSEMLRPTRWGELASGITRGVEALPGVRVPYRGVEPWTRTVIPLGGTVIVTVAALLAFWPRRTKLGFPLVALALLVLLYVVPAIALIFTVEFLRGAVLAVLVLAFLRLEKLRVRDVNLAAGIAGAVALGGLMIAPALNADQPWWDYEHWADDAAASKSVSYSWNHSYGQLSWPRDGREMLRVKAKRPAYWKAENLDAFDGIYWRHADISTEPVNTGTPDRASSLQQWTQRIQVTVRNLKSPQFITAGYAETLSAPTIGSRLRADGTYMATRDLKRGDAYSAVVYSPQPTERQRRAARLDDGTPMRPYLSLMLQERGDLGQFGQDSFLVTFPRRGEPGEPRAAFPGEVKGNAEIARIALTEGPYARVWQLALQLRRGTATEEDYVENVLQYLRDGFTYSEIPPVSSRTLPGFLLDSKTGYCQQFSGAMALLLRMGGIPARVAVGFTSGALDRKTHEYVVRDLDAHSWVEVWYPGYGWVTFDPTPASAPPRAQPDEAGTNAQSAGASLPPNLPGDAPRLRGRQLLATEEGRPWWQLPLAIVGVLVLLAGAVWAWRVRRRPSLSAIAELERALHRARRDPGPGTTLRSLETSFSGTPAAAGYVRAVRDARYGGRPATPTPSQRRGLRSELGRGGLLSRLRAWWALPPSRG